jgi:hypothetical protein
MARGCRYAIGSRSGTAEWVFDQTSLVVTPADGGPIPLAVRELIGLDGDGYTLRLVVPTADGKDELVLSMLGAEGPTLLDSLRRCWLEARAEALRLSGSGAGRPFLGSIAGPDDSDTSEPFQALLFGDVLALARNGRDVEPIFLALTETVEFDADTYSVRVREWPGREVVFSRLAKQTEAFGDRLRANRVVLAQEAEAGLARAVPQLPAGSRAALAGIWLPGRLLPLATMEDLCAGFREAFAAGWLPGLLRVQEGARMLEWTTPERIWLGCSREESASGGLQLWMLAGKGGAWFLESLTDGDRATYCFTGGDEIPALVSRLLCAPQFSREALYGSPDMLTGDRADLAIAAQFLGFLVRLRAAFRSRVIHRGLEGWQSDMEALVSDPKAIVEQGPTAP